MSNSFDRRAGVPAPDERHIAEALAVLFDRSHVVELRAIRSKGRKRTDSGYFDGDHWKELAAHGARLASEGAAVYVTINPVNPQLLGRSANRVTEWASTTTTDTDVLRRRWLLIDIDPERPAGTSATNVQLNLAKERAKAIARELESLGWSKPVVAISGNGVHLLYPIDLPNDAASTSLIRGVLKSLNDRFGDKSVKVDETVHNAGRIVKLYGTVANKGDHLPDMPWRPARLTGEPKRNAPISVQLLEAIQPPPASGHPMKGSSDSSASIRLAERILDSLGISARRDVHTGMDRLRLDRCPFNPEHGFGEAAILIEPGGKVRFKCQHDSCGDKGWRDVRALVDPGGAPPEPKVERIGRDWPPVRPLGPASGEAPNAYPVEALPDGIREAVMEAADFIQCPIGICASSALAALSMAGQGLVDVARSEALVGPTSLYLLTVAESGERKTSADSMFVRAIREHEEWRSTEDKPALREYERVLQAWEAKKRGVLAQIERLARNGDQTHEQDQLLELLDQERPVRPTMPKLIYAETTAEGLAWGLHQDWPAAGLLSSEAGAVLGSHGMGRESVMRMLALLNALWEGEPHSVARRTSENYVLRNARFTIGLSVQPDTLRDFVTASRGLARGMGFLARFLVSWPESTQGTRLFREGNAKFPYVESYRLRVGSLLGSHLLDESARLVLQTLHLAPNAKDAWIRLHDDIERELGAGGELVDVRDVASKAAENAARLAALFHTFAGGPQGVIGSDCVERAGRIVVWHVLEARRLLSAHSADSGAESAERLERWIVLHCQEKGRSHVGWRYVLQYGPGPLRSAEALENAMRRLTSAGRARMVDAQGKAIEVNPELLGGS